MKSPKLPPGILMTAAFSLTFKRTAKFFQDESKSSRFGSVDGAAQTGPVKTTELAGDVSNRIQPHLVRRVGQPRP